MDKKIAVTATIIIVLAVIIVYNILSIITAKQTVVENNLPDKVKEIVASQMAVEKSEPKNPLPVFAFPLERAGERVTKKTFGQYITPQNSPVKPERFRGFHTGTDLEIFPEELGADVPVRAICGGKIVQKKWAGGYGGLLVQNCELEGEPASPEMQRGEPITAIYGHLKFVSITKKAGDALAKGEEIGILGKAYSSETSGERKHLHLGIRKDSAIDIRGYVRKESELSGWLDPCLIEEVCR